jgi:5-(carboxyamino)imidazole ribonucleotide synthase
MQTPKNIGIIGGGQLGMMLLQAAAEDSPEVNYSILEASEDCPAGPFADNILIGSLKNDADLRRLAANCDVITWEIEHIGVDTLVELEKEGKTIIPRPSVLKIIQDKGIQKLFYRNHGIPTAPFVLVNSKAHPPKEILNELKGSKVVVKARTGGYDGKGVEIVNKEQLESGLYPFEGEVVLEEFVENVLELAVIVAVDQQGNMETFPIIEMYFNSKSNLVEFLFSPAQIADNIEKRSVEIALNSVRALNSEGLFAVELFVTPEGEIWVNEMAPRPHNSGHHTIEGCATSQFAQLNRILLGKELGSTELLQPSAMINVVGPEGISGKYYLANAIEWEERNDIFVHMYGKTETRPHRKLGHITVTDSTVEGLLEKAARIQKEIEIKPS